MGSVKTVHTTGDNDPEIFPKDYHAYYLYCDKCGSFEIKQWIEPPNHMELIRLEKRLGQLATVSLVATLISIVLAIFGLYIFLGITLLALTGWYVGASLVGAKIRYLGVYCAKCQTRYENNSRFMVNFKENPLGLTMSDLPLPLYLNYQIRGNYLQ